MTRAVVLSGGGPVGIAWETGIALGLRDAGVDLAEADLIVGTSAGSVVGAQIALGRDLGDQIERSRTVRSTPGAQAHQSTIGARMLTLMELMQKASESQAPETERLAGFGSFALESDTVPEDVFLGNFSYLAGDEWPRRFTCTAIDADDGRFVAWDETAGVDRVRAIASSCAVPGVFPPITIDGRRYIDGGMRSVTNADLAKGHDRVLIVTLVGMPPAGVEDPRAARYRRVIEAEHAILSDAGATIETVAPDAETSAAIGLNLMDPTVAPAGADAGLLQGKREAERIATFWE